VAFFRNRAYDERTGRWTQEDPIGLAGGVNLYQFNGNNPVAYTDPFGLCPDNLSAGKSLLCNVIEATSTAVGLLGGFAVGAGGGALEIAGSGGLLAPVAAAGIATSTAAGGAIGLKAGQALTSMFFSDAGDKARPKTGSEQRDEIEKAQETYRKRGEPDRIKSIGKSKQRGKVSDRQKAQDALDGVDEP